MFTYLYAVYNVSGIYLVQTEQIDSSQTQISNPAVMPSRRSKPAHKVTKRAGAVKAPVPSAQPQTAIPDNPVYFWSEKDPVTGYLSQWYACAFTDDTDPTIVYPTAEQ